jgi:hypothetical protein
MTDGRIRPSMTPQGPFLSEDAKSNIQRCFEKGDKRALFEMLYWCSAMGLPVPDWAAMAINKAYWQFDRGALKSWEEVFGKPFPGKSRKKAVTDSHAMAVQIEVRRLIGQGHALDEALFEKAAKKLRIGKRSTVSKLYYRALPPILRRKKKTAKN